MTHLSDGSSVFSQQGEPDIICFKKGSLYYAVYSKDNNGNAATPNTNAATVIARAYAVLDSGVIGLTGQEFDCSGSSISISANSNIWLRGCGMDRSVIKNGNIVKNDTAVRTNMWFSDLTIDANSSTGTCMNLATNAKEYRLDRVKMKNSSSSFLLNWAQVDHLIARDCQFFDGGLTLGKDNAAGSQITTNENETQFLNCYFQKDSSLGGAMLTTGQTGNVLVDGGIFVDNSNNCYASVSIEGVGAASKEIRVVNCRGYGQNMSFQIGLDTSTSIDLALVSNCVSTGGVLINHAKRTLISNSEVHDSPYGFFLNDAGKAQLSNNVAFNLNILSSATKTDKAGIYSKDTAYLGVNGFQCYDTAGSPTTPYGIYIDQTNVGSNYAILHNVELIGTFDVGGASILKCLYAVWRDGILTGALDTTNTTTFAPFNIVGYVTANQGTGTINSGATSATITHGLGYTPNRAEITITLGEDPTNTPGAIYVDTITSTQFTVHSENDPGASNLDFSWSVRKV